MRGNQKEIQEVHQTVVAKHRHHHRQNLHQFQKNNQPSPARTSLKKTSAAYRQVTIRYLTQMKGKKSNKIISLLSFYYKLFLIFKNTSITLSTP
jgi:hypothetical protein